ncbi:MAG: hypothetical protein ACJA00_002460 [Myxococcota bacterium]
MSIQPNIALLALRALGTGDAANRPNPVAPVVDNSTVAFDHDCAGGHAIGGEVRCNGGDGVATCERRMMGKSVAGVGVNGVVDVNVEVVGVYSVDGISIVGGYGPGRGCELLPGLHLGHVGDAHAEPPIVARLKMGADSTDVAEQRAEDTAVERNGLRLGPHGSCGIRAVVQGEHNLRSVLHRLVVDVEQTTLDVERFRWCCKSGTR